MRLILLRCLSLLALVFFNTALRADTWEFVEEKQGIKIYQKRTPGSDFIGFRGVKTMPVAATKIAQVMLDPRTETKKKWIDRMLDFRALEIKGNEAYTYMLFDLPWPLAKRDYVVHSRFSMDNRSNQIWAELRSGEHSSAPPTAGVRAELTASLYKIVAKSENVSEVTVEILTDPRGKLPAWIVNFIQSNWPINTLTKMEAVALLPETEHHPELVKIFKPSFGSALAH